MGRAAARTAPSCKLTTRGRNPVEAPADGIADAGEVVDRGNVDHASEPAGRGSQWRAAFAPSPRPEDGLWVRPSPTEAQESRASGGRTCAVRTATRHRPAPGRAAPARARPTCPPPARRRGRPPRAG